MKVFFHSLTRDGRDMETTVTRFIKQKFHLEPSAILL